MFSTLPLTIFGKEKKMQITTQVDSRVFSKMQKGNPLRTYKKEIRGQLLIRILNPFNPTIVEELILQGNPGDLGNKKQFIDLWTEEEVAFFEVSNEEAIKEGRVILWTKEVPREIEKSINNLSDEEIEELVNSPFIKLKNTVGKMTSEAAVHRVIRKAEEVERPEKTMLFLRETLAKLQFGDPNEKME